VRGAGDRNRLITFIRPVATQNDYGEEIEGAPATIVRARARVTYGSGQERREAAAQQASQSATFEVLWTPVLDGVQMTDRIQFDGADWNITNRALVGLNREIHFTGVRAAS
jgi:head-tail adaptor